ncbi:hypothetical protein INR49_023725 [Caranx melampygus]|nr:hypothetical protein INR49_023725 [Caranx melampygus]
MLNSGSTNQGEEPKIPPIRVQEAGQKNKRSLHTCDLCDKVIIGDLEWTAHLKSKKHHYHVRKKRKSDLTCDKSQSTAAAPASTGETLSKDTSCAPVAPGCSENSQDTRTTHKEVPWHKPPAQRECVFPAVIAGLCLCNSVLYPISNQGVPAYCKSTYTIPGLSPKVSLGAPFPSPHLPLFLLTSAPFLENQSRIVWPHNPSSHSPSPAQ